MEVGVVLDRLEGGSAGETAEEVLPVIRSWRLSQQVMQT